jgi:hypothetical protein
MYVSRWSDAEKAQEFAAIYAKSLSQRYTKAEEVGDNSSSSTRPSKYKIALLQGRHTWNTKEGTVVIDQEGDTVLVTEGLDAATTQTLEKEVFKK